MSTIACEVCGGPATVHLTEVRRRWLPPWRVDRSERHYCLAHAPEEFRAKVVAVEQDLGDVLARALREIEDRTDLDDATKSRVRGEMRDAIAELRGREPPGDVH